MAISSHLTDSIHSDILRLLLLGSSTLGRRRVQSSHSLSLHGVEILLAHVNTSDQISHLVRLDVLSFLSLSTRDRLLVHLGSLDGLLPHFWVGHLRSPQRKIHSGSHLGQRNLWYFGPRSKHLDGIYSDVDERQLFLALSTRVDTFQSHGGRTFACLISVHRSCSDRHDSLESLQRNLCELVAVVEVEEHGFEELKGRMGGEKGGLERHEDSVTRSRFW